MRTIETHVVNVVNDRIKITVMDKPGPGGACHNYVVSWQPERGPLCERMVNFQNGPISKVGVNGVTHEALLAILIDRLDAFQHGDFASDYNKEALRYLELALQQLRFRTAERMARGVEGTSQK